MHLELTNDGDAAAIAALRLATSRQLTEQFGRGTWSFAAESSGGVRVDIMTSTVVIVRERGTVLATARLSTRPPWMGSIDVFTPCRTALYLTSMAVAPKAQRQGNGRRMLEEVKRYAREWPADALRLDAYDAPAGAGEFYRKCGFAEVRSASYNGTPLIFFELMLRSNAAASATAVTAQST